MESLRIEAPLNLSSTMMVTEDVQAGGYTIKKDIPIVIDMRNLQRNPE